jgi:hypothetical protein
LVQAIIITHLPTRERQVRSFNYRIQIQDVNGAAYYSNVAIVTNSAGTSISVYPNPADNGLTLLTSDKDLLHTTAKIYDAAGRLVSAVLINQKQYIDLHNLPKGVLLLQLSVKWKYLYHYKKIIRS